MNRARILWKQVASLGLLMVLLFLGGCVGAPGATSLPATPSLLSLEPTVTPSSAPAQPGAKGIDAPTPTEIPQPLASPTSVPTLAPTDTRITPPSVSSSDEPLSDEPLVLVANAANIRSGPGTQYPVVGSAASGERFPITGVSAQGDWWQIAYADSVAWIYAPLVTAVGGEGVSVADAPPLPQPPTVTPQPDSGNAGSAPAPAPVGTVVVYESSVTLPTYPYNRYLSPARNETYNWPYQRFDQERYQQDRPGPENRTYKLIVLENAYLQVTLLPELGGRIWQAIHKPTGANLFYQNPVIKPSTWGPPEQLGWLAVGGVEWALPVVEHGYAWGELWGYSPLQHSPDLASVTLFTPQDGRYLVASITISLRAGAAAFDVEPTIANVSDHPLDFAFWSTAMLAPGAGNKPSAATQFFLPGQQMTVHSTGDARLPAPGQAFDWPNHNGVDYSRLGNYQQWLGFFERPAAHGPYVALYDTAANAGGVRIYPANVARGSKVFALGWQAAIGSDNFTDDGSAYVELHGGLAPTFDDTYRLPAGGAVSWREVWYPVHGIGGLSSADEVAAIHLYPEDGGLSVGFYPTRPMDGALVVAAGGQEAGRIFIKASPDAPFVGRLLSGEQMPASGPLAIRFEDAAGRLLIETTYAGPLR